MSVELVDGHEARRPLPEQRGGRGDHRRPLRQPDARVHLQVRLHPAARGQADRLDSSHPHPTQHDGIAYGEAADGSEPRGAGRFGAAEVEVGEPQRAGDDGGEGRDDG